MEFDGGGFEWGVGSFGADGGGVVRVCEGRWSFCLFLFFLEWVPFCLARGLGFGGWVAGARAGYFLTLFFGPLD